MSGRRHGGRWALVSAVAVVVAGLGVPSVTSPATARDVVPPKPQQVRVKWEGTWGDPTFVKTAVVPGIGNLALVCKPDNTIVRLFARERGAETQMWMAKYEWKNGRRAVAVKNARIYRYAHALDDGTGGTGRYTHEGLNQWTPIENRSEGGFMYGVISQRPGRHQDAGGVALRPATAFRLTWFWNGFGHPMAYRSCEISADLVTHFDSRAGVSWHGEDDALRDATGSTGGNIGGHTLSESDWGDYRSQVRCEPDLDGDGEQTVAFAPEAPPASDVRLYAEEITGEGSVENHVDTIDIGYDEETHLFGPVEVPRNGMMRLFIGAPGQQREFILSSYHVLNNRRDNPALNLCEIALAPMP